jgi:starch phosphorylase
LGDALPVVFVPGYDMALARHLCRRLRRVAQQPAAADGGLGHLGMKAALNGVLNFSVLDGWWIEACEEGITGWAVGEDEAALLDAPATPPLRPGTPPEAPKPGFLPLDAAEGPEAHARLLYEKLEGTILPLYHGDRAAWVRMMGQAIARIGPVFNSQHMMRRYASEAYLR